MLTLSRDWKAWAWTQNHRTGTTLYCNQLLWKHVYNNKMWQDMGAQLCSPGGDVVLDSKKVGFIDSAFAFPKKRKKQSFPLQNAWKTSLGFNWLLPATLKGWQSSTSKVSNWVKLHGGLRLSMIEQHHPIHPNFEKWRSMLAEHGRTALRFQVC